MEKLANFLIEKNKKKILDIGTGAGNFIHLLKSLYTEYDEIVGIDTIEGAVKAASKQFEADDKISFQVMNALDMSFSDGYFDLVCLSNSLHHLVDINTILKEMERVLAPGGHILFAEMINNDLSVRQISHMKLHHFAAKIDRLRGDTHNDTYSDKEIIAILNKESSLTVTDSWSLKYERRGENTKEEMEWFNTTIDRLMSRVVDPEVKIEYQKEAEEIRTYINKHGFDSCTTVVAVMEK